MNKKFKSLGFYVYGFTFIVALIVFFATIQIQAFNEKGPLKDSKIIEIPRGSSLGFIAEKLSYENVISDPFLFKIGAKVLREATNLKAGEYEFPAGISMHGTINLLKDGKSYQRFITFREGLTSYEIIQQLNNAEKITGEPIADIPAEGSLLPETYSFHKGETKNDIIKRMRDAMDQIKSNTPTQICDGEMPVDTPCLPKPLENWNDVITLASIVEKETSVPEERHRVAGVFINRLRNNIALQTDPTVIYAITMGQHENEGLGPLGRRLLKKDLELDSPYNTYKYPGLPPGPIANPGKASIEAVLNPEDHNLYYFVADGQGGHAFAATLEEHNANVAKWRTIRRTME